MEARNHLQNKASGITSSRWNMGARFYEKKITNLHSISCRSDSRQ
jgi:hypothetical protein